MSVSLIYIRCSTPLTILRLPKPVFGVYIRNCTIILYLYCWWSSSNSKSTNYVIKVICWNCDTMAIGDSLYKYELIWSQLWTNRFVSPRASESTLSYTHWVRNSLMIAANDRTLNLTMLYWSQMYSILQQSCFAIYWMESIPCHLGYMNRKSYSPQTKKVWSK
jgi:hypothetical protein